MEDKCRVRNGPLITTYIRKIWITVKTTIVGIRICGVTKQFQTVGHTDLLITVRRQILSHYKHYKRDATSIHWVWLHIYEELIHVYYRSEDSSVETLPL